MSQRVDSVPGSNEDFQTSMSVENVEDVNEETKDFINSSIAGPKKNKNKIRKPCQLWLAIIIIAAVLYIAVQKYLENQTYREFDEYFVSKARVIPSTIPLKSQYSPITWPELGSLKIVNITVIVQTSGRTEMLNSTLFSFFKYNSYPVQKIIAIHDGEINPNLQAIINSYQNITWIIKNVKVGQLAAIDQAYKHIDTQYYFHTEDDWEYLRSGFIQYCIQALDFDPKLNGLHLTHKMAYQSQFFMAGPLRIMTQLQLPYYSGFSFYPSAHRMKEYRKLPRGYVGASYNVSYAKGVGNCESFISKQYSVKNYHYASSPLQFVNHTGAGKGSPSKFWGTTPVNAGWILKLIRYQLWYVFHSNRHRQQTKLKYLFTKQKQLGLKSSQNSGQKLPNS